MKGIISALVLAMLTIFCAQNVYAMKYYVYCVNGKIEIDSRDPQKMKSARGSGTYAMSEFDYRIDAEKFAKQLGGVGASCPRR